jgi:hypothetical protein
MITEFVPFDPAGGARWRRARVLIEKLVAGATPAPSTASS